MARHRVLIASLIIAFAFVMGGCKKKAGDKCSAGQAACSDGKTALFCANGTLATMSCRGATGCNANGENIDCDNSVASESDGCNTVGDVACTDDHKSALECTADFKFKIGETCKGPGGCAIKGESITCDNDTADLGDPCHFNGDYACTSDKSLVLRCDANKMTALNTCRGPKSCRIIELPQEKKVDFFCDDSVAQEGDACDTNGEEACSMDKKALYKCQSNKFAAFRQCTGPGGCSYMEQGDRYSCEVAGGAVAGTAGGAAGSTGAGTATAGAATVGAANGRKPLPGAPPRR